MIWSREEAKQHLTHDVELINYGRGESVIIACSCGEALISFEDLEKPVTKYLWDDDTIQFSRLLAEIVATQDHIDIKTLCESMDLKEEQIEELFGRAQKAWDKQKATL